MSTDPFQFVATFTIGTGSGAIVLAVVRAVFKWVSGSSGREKSRNTSLEQQRAQAVQERDLAESDRDYEARRRRKLEEYASTLRRLLMENGITAPGWPTETTSTRKHTKENQ